MGTQYATAAELTATPGAGAYVKNVTDADLDAQLLRASGLADDYLQRRYTLPLSAWSQSLRQAVCHIAAYWLASHKGFDAGAAGSTARRLYEDAIKILESLATNGGAGITDSTPDVQEGTGFVSTLPRRGWRRR